MLQCPDGLLCTPNSVDDFISLPRLAPNRAIEPNEHTTH